MQILCSAMSDMLHRAFAQVPIRCMLNDAQPVPTANHSPRAHATIRSASASVTAAWVGRVKS